MSDEGLFDRLMSKPGFLAFLDGRNQYGTHVLASYPQTMPAEEAIAENAGEPEVFEKIMVEAEKLGFGVGDFVWTVWHRFMGQYDGEGRCEFPPYWEYCGIDLELTKAMQPKGKPDV